MPSDEAIAKDDTEKQKEEAAEMTTEEEKAPKKKIDPRCMQVNKGEERGDHGKIP